MDTGLRGKTAIVTGGAGAIGAAIATALACEGAAVGVTWHADRARAEQLVASLAHEGARAHSVHLDQADPAGADNAVAEIRDVLGPIAVVVANAVAWPESGLPEVDALAASLATNTVGTLALIGAALPDMRATRWGRVVVVSTDIVAQPLPGPLGYAAAKGALEAAARVLAVREAPHGILTNVVRPGFTLTERALNSPFLGRAAIDAEAARTPTGRVGTPEDVASTITYLACLANSHINGQIISVAGGRELLR